MKRIAVFYLERRFPVRRCNTFSIGLGNALTDVTFSAYGDPIYNGQKLMERIAQKTGGEAYFAPTTEELETIFEWIADSIFVRLKE